MPIRRAVLALLAVALAAPAAASAGAPGRWTQIGPGGLRNIDEVALTRTGDSALHAIWTMQESASAQGLQHASITPGGAVAVPNAVTSGWAAITSTPDVVTMPDGSLRVFFGAIHSTTPGDPNTNMNTATANASGAGWALFPGTIVNGDSAYAGDDGAAVLPDGTPLLSFGGTGAGAFVHRGLDPNTPNFALQGQLGGCCGYSPDIAVDTKTGEAFVVWYSNADDNFGVFAQSLNVSTGQPQGSPTKMPGSTTPFNGREESSQQLSRTPIVARAGGGVYVAYPGGYPTTTKVVLWRIAGSKSAVVGTSKNNHLVSLAADPEGRLWVFWVDRGSAPLVFARRSNEAVTKFGPAVKVGPPRGLDTAYKIAGSAQRDRLDVVTLFTTAGAQAHFHTQVLPGLAVSLKPSKLTGNTGGSVTVKVTEPDVVKGAKVAGGGESATTGANGKATLSFGATRKRSITLTVKKGGYTPRKVKLKVSH